MRTYVIGRVGDNYAQPWKAYRLSFHVIQVETTDRRKARKVVRLARALGYSDVKFWIKQLWIN